LKIKITFSPDGQVRNGMKEIKITFSYWLQNNFFHKIQIINIKSIKQLVLT